MTKKEQMIQIADALEEAGMFYGCEFSWSKRIGEHSYGFSLERRYDCLMLTARLPLTLSEESLRWERKLAEANRSMTAGRFEVSDRSVLYRLYSLLDDCEDVKDAQAVSGMIQRAEKDIEEHAEPMLAPGPALTFLQKINPLRAIFGDAW